MPFNSLFAAFTINWFISSADVVRDGSKTKSTADTFGVGTRIATPSSLPSNFGKTRPTALAAPVVVGIIFNAAARERYKSLCSVSSMRWSPV